MSVSLFEEKVNYLIVLASMHGYRKDAVNYQTSYVSFIKTEVKIIVYLTKNGYTVATCLNHPKKGKTQLVRKRLNNLGLISVFKNPRIHTQKCHFVDEKYRKSV